MRKKNASGVTKTGTTPVGKPYETTRFKTPDGVSHKSTRVEAKKAIYEKDTRGPNGKAAGYVSRGIENKGNSNKGFKAATTKWSKAGGKLPKGTK